MAGQEKGDLLIQVTAWPGLTTCIMMIFFINSLLKKGNDVVITSFSPGVENKMLVNWQLKVNERWEDKNDLYIHVQSNLSYVTFQGNIEIGSHKTGGHLIQV